MSNDILKFTDENFYLSNFYECNVSIMVENKVYVFRSSEALYQACKCPSRFKEFLNLNPDQAKRLGKKVKLRSDWESMKRIVMRRTLMCKFIQNPDLRRKLTSTCGRRLEESNDWGDRYWGTVNGEGNNYLGLELMSLRNVFRLSDSSNSLFPINFNYDFTGIMK